MSSLVCTTEHLGTMLAATIFCRHCKRYMCSKCASRHATMPTCHTVVPVDKLQEPQCMVHRKIKDLFCERCHQFICGDCIYDDKHNGHTMKAASDIAKERQQRVDYIKERSTIKLTELRNQENKIKDVKRKIEYHIDELDCVKHANYLEGDDLTAYQEHCKDLEKLINDETFGGSPSGLAELNVKPSTSGESDKIKRKKVNDHQQSEKEREKKKNKREDNDARDYTQQQDAHLLVSRSMPGTLKNTPLQRKLTSGGVGTSATGSSMPMKATQKHDAHLLVSRSMPGTSKNTVLQKKLTASSGVGTLATASGSSMPVKASSIIGTFDLPAWMEGMDSVTADTVVICFGGPRSSTGQRQLCASYFSISGEQGESLDASITKASDIAHLKDDRLVVAHEKGTMRVYQADGSQTGGFRSPTMKGFCQLCCDQKNNIYIVNGSSKILKYHPDGNEVQREIPTGKVKPEQICVTADGAYLVTTSNLSQPITITIFDRGGNKVDTISADPYSGKYLYAAIDAQDKVLVASACVQSNVGKLSLERYSLREGKFSMRERFSDVTLSPIYSQKFPWCYMVSLSPRMLAFAYEQKLHFIQLH